MLISEYRHCPRLPSDLDIRKRTREQGSNSAEYEETHALFHRGKICSDVQTPFQFELRTPQKIRFQKTKLRAVDLPSVPAWSVCLSVCLVCLSVCHSRRCIILYEYGSRPSKRRQKWQVSTRKLTTMTLPNEARWQIVE